MKGGVIKAKKVSYIGSYIKSEIDGKKISNKSYEKYYKRYDLMSNGLKAWFKQKWVDIGSKRKDGSFRTLWKVETKADAKRKYPKCVPLAKARRMTDAQRRSAVARKRAVANVGPKPTNVKTILKRDIVKIRRTKKENFH